MREYVEDKFFVSFVILLGCFTYFMGINNNKQLKEENNNIIYVEK